MCNSWFILVSTPLRVHRGIHLSDRGMYDLDRGNVPIPCRTEEDIFAALDMEYKPPSGRVLVDIKFPKGPRGKGPRYASSAETPGADGDATPPIAKSASAPLRPSEVREASSTDREDADTDPDG